MKKRLIWIAICLVVLIAIIAALLPFGLGIAVQHKYSQVLQAWSHEDNVKLNLVSYHRGWFHSDAVVQVTLTHPTLMQINKWLGNDHTGPIQFTLNQRIDHGPLLRISSPEGKQRYLLGRAVVKSSMKTALGAIDTITFAEMDGSILSVVNAPDLHLVNPAKGVSAKITDLTATFLLSSDLSQMFASIDAPLTKIDTSDFLQQIHNLSEQFSLRKSPSGLFLGWRTTKIDNASWETADHSSKIQLTGLTMQSQSSEQSAKMSYKLNTILNKLIFDSGSYGPQQIKLSITNLDVPTLLAIRKELTGITGAEALSTTQLMRYNNLFFMLLSKGLEFNIDKLNLDLPSGHFEASLHLALAPQATMATSIKSFLDYLQARAHIQMPAAMLTKWVMGFNQSTIGRMLVISGATPGSEQQVSQQIQQWVQKKWLIPEDDSYLSDISYKNKQFQVNGVTDTVY